MAAVTPQERQYYDHLFEFASKDDTGVLAGKDALPLLTASGLPQQTLGEVWALADPNNNGFLTKDNWYKVARLIGWLQHGDGSTQVDLAVASKPGPLPTFKGDYPRPPPAVLPSLTMSPQVTGSTADGAGARLPPLTQADRIKFTRIFVNCPPSNGLVAGDKARDLFLRSKLNYDKLGQIWNLADTQQRGSLDLADFVIGMHLIQSCMTNPALSLPAVLPPGLYEQASGGRPPPSKPTMPGQAGPTSPIQRQMTGGMQPQITGQSISAVAGTSSPTSAIGQTRQSTFPPPSTGAGSGAAWDVTPEAKAASDQYFAQLDTQGKGVIEGDVAVPFMVQSQLDEGVLASIWDLSDIRQEGKLDKDEFAVAMHLINMKLAGKDIPTTLPTSLIPPKSRSGQQLPQPTSATRDLFDLFNDPPESGAGASSVAAAPAFLPQPPSRRATGQESSRRLAEPQTAQRPQIFAGAANAAPAGDLLGDDAQEAQASSLPDASADIGNKRNQLSNITRSVGDLETTRGSLEQSATSSAAELEKLNTELVDARAKHETETKAVSDLRIRVGEQTTQLKQLRAEVISAESDLNAMRMEKDELEQSLLHDKEEVRGLQKRMKELGDEKAGLKLLLDKLKKDARQQKGMTSIARKQLSTAESSRDAVQQEVRDAEHPTEVGDAQSTHSPSLTAAAGVPLPHTPRALSPEATGASQRSLNPFDRLGRNSASRPSNTASVAGPQSSQTSALGGAALAGAGLAAGATIGAFAASHSSSGDAQHEGDVSQGTVPAGQDAFGVPSEVHQEAQPAAASEDPFGVPPTQPQSGAFETSGFGDSFGEAASANAHEVQGHPQGNQEDFDSAFADFDNNPTGATEQNLRSEDHDTFITPTESLGQSGTFGAAAPEHVPTGDEVAQQEHGSAPTAEHEQTLSAEHPVDAQTAELRPEAERTASTQAIAPASDHVSPTVDQSGLPVGASAIAAAPAARNDGEESSDDENEGPEDLDAPRHGFASPHSGEPIAPFPPAHTTDTHDTEDHSAKSRRSAPPPPAGRGASVHSPQGAAPVDPFGNEPVAQSADAGGLDASTETGAVHSNNTALDPFGAPAFGAPAFAAAAPGFGAGGQQQSQFEDEDAFDFSDQPPASSAPAEHSAVPAEHSVPPAGQPPHAQTLAAANPSSAFDDEFANFDDEFDAAPSQTNSGSDNSNSLLQSYEVVPSQTAPHPPTSDAWGMNRGQDNTGANPGSTLSFDDAFGGDFEPSHSAAQPNVASAIPGQEHPAASGSAPATRPSLPQRPSTVDGAQADDLEDVKKLCSMGFSRSLAVEALDANGYDFQKALNVLLVK